MNRPSQDPDGRRARERETLARWLEEWHLDALLPEPEPAAAGSTPEGGAAPSHPGVPAPRPAGPEPPAVGDIRLLAPETPATRDRPVYVAVLRALPPDGWLVAPFGRFATPAVPGEWATRRAAPPLRVLCAWNRAVLPQARLVGAWRAGRLSTVEQRQVARLLAALSSAGPLPAVLAARVGPPLLHPADPRHLYVAQERALWSGERALRLAEPPAPYSIGNPSPAAQPLAAEPRDSPYAPPPPPV